MPILGIIDSAKTGHLVTGNFDNIATVTGNGSATALTFSSIPSGYKSLHIRGIARDTASGSASGNTIKLTLNGDTANNYTAHNVGAAQGVGLAVSGNGSPAQGGFTALYQCAGSSTAAGMYGVNMIDIPDYASTAKYKTIKMNGGLEINATTTGSEQVDFHSGLWMSTAAITSITLTLTSSAFTTLSTYTLYGVS